MTVWAVPWLELAIVTPLLGAAWVGRFRDPTRALTWGLAIDGATVVFAALAWLQFATGAPAATWSAQPALFGRTVFAVDELSAPLVPLVALIHGLTMLATGRTKVPRFSPTGSLAAETVRLATFACPGTEPWVLIGLLGLSAAGGWLGLVRRRGPTRVYAIHLSAFVGLLAAGWAMGSTALLAAAVLIRCGVAPVHGWVADLFEHGGFGKALLTVTPLTGVYAAVRLLLPVAPESVLQGVGLAGLATAVYAAGLAVVQTDARRFFAHQFISQSSLVLVGLGLLSDTGLTAALALWVSVSLALTGFGLTLRALESRYGRLSLTEFHGLYDHSPALGVCFLVTGLASVGFPGTLGFVAAELTAGAAVEAHPAIGVAVVLAAAVNGIAVVRAYLALFGGARRHATVPLTITPRERVAVLTVTALILGGGLVPQPWVASRHRAAEALVGQRANRVPADPALLSQD